jgi:hypothetical protein
MAFGKSKPAPAAEPVKAAPNDPTGWLVDSDVAQFLLMNTYAIKYMCMVGYTYLHGT